MKSKVLQLALDRATIAKTFYGSSVDGEPAGLVSPEFKGWCTPYDEWPKVLQDEYSYNPTDYDAMVTKLETTSDPAELSRVSTEADMYAIGKHWAVQVCSTVTFAVWQPYLKGYSSESAAGTGSYAHYARWWID
jgi:hypothetical protein